jgi:hypothetical protein
VNYLSFYQFSGIRVKLKQIGDKMQIRLWLIVVEKSLNCCIYFELIT